MLLLAKKQPKLGIQLPNAEYENQSCCILMVIFNQINWLQAPQYNLYSGALFYTNVTISTLLWVSKLRPPKGNVEIVTFV